VNDRLQEKGHIDKEAQAEDGKRVPGATSKNPGARA